MPKDTWKNSRDIFDRNTINQSENWEHKQRLYRESLRTPIRNPDAYWAAVRRNKQIENEKWAKAFQKMTQAPPIDPLGSFSRVDVAQVSSEVSERGSGANQATRTPHESTSLLPKGSDDPRDGQLTLFEPSTL